MEQRLERFYLPGLKEVGTELGHGSFAVVVEFQLHGLKCAGKKLHPQLCDTNPEEREKLVSRFEEECGLLAYIRHPNIVQFLGLSHDRETNTPILVMEYLESSLTACLNLNGILPDEFNYSIIDDIVTGLCFLHNQIMPIVHRDLTPNNVLLTKGMTAKISDLGVAKILNFDFVKKSQMTTCPGTTSYMPPEALAHDCVHNCSIDIFALGVLMLHMFCGEWPTPGEANRVDPRDPTKLIPLTERERRTKYISKLSPAHSLLSVIEQCLCNYPPHRPKATQVLEHVRAQCHPETKNKLQMAMELKQLSIENKHLSKLQNSTFQQEEKVVHQTLERVTRVEELLEELLGVKDGSQTTKEAQLPVATPSKAAAPCAKVKDGLLGESKPQSIENKGMPFRFHLKSCKDFKKQIVGNPNCIVFQNTLYVGAGYSETEQDGHLIFSYNQFSDSWNQLPPTPHALFGLGYLEHGIVAVGGVTTQQNMTQEVFILDSKAGAWKKTLPELPTARFRPTVISHLNAIAVCGGIDSSNRVSGVVEVLMSGSKHWYSAPSLPIPCAIAKPIIIGEHCYLVGGYKQWRPVAPANSVQCISLPGILTPGTGGSWKLLPDTPNNRPVPVSVGGALLVIGGWNRDGVSDTIHAYSEKLNNWIRIGTWSIPFRSGGSAILPSGEAVVIGGLADNGKNLSQVVIVSLQLS